MSCQKRVVLGPVGSAFVHHDGGSVLQRTVNDVAVAGDPADICGAEVDVVFLEIKDVLAGEVGLDGVAAGRVYETLRFACRPAGVEKVERVFGVHWLARAGGRGGGEGFVPVEIAAFFHLDGSCGLRRAFDGGALVDDDVAHGRALRKGFVDDGFEPDLRAAAIANVLRDDGDALRIVDSVDDRLGGEASEDNGVDGADAGAGEQRHGQLGAHAHVDGDAIAFADARAT